MPKKVAERKAQFSIYMDRSTKDAIERIAAHRGLNASSLLELMAQNLVASVDPETWAKLDDVESALGAAIANASSLTARPRVQSHPKAASKR